MLLISHYGNAVLLMGLNALLWLPFILRPPNGNTKAKNHLAGHSLMSLVFLWLLFVVELLPMSLMCLSVRGSRLFIHVRIQDNLNQKQQRELIFVTVFPVSA